MSRCATAIFFRKKSFFGLQRFVSVNKQLAHLVSKLYCTEGFCQRSANFYICNLTISHVRIGQGQRYKRVSVQPSCQSISKSIDSFESILDRKVVWSNSFIPFSTLGCKYLLIGYFCVQFSYIYPYNDEKKSMRSSLVVCSLKYDSKLGAHVISRKKSAFNASQTLNNRSPNKHKYRQEQFIRWMYFLIIVS